MVVRSLRSTRFSPVTTFFFQVEVQGKFYMPATSSDTKKGAKADAAQRCLEELGLLPKAATWPDNQPSPLSRFFLWVVFLSSSVLCIEVDGMLRKSFVTTLAAHQTVIISCDSMCAMGSWRKISWRHNNLMMLLQSVWGLISVMAAFGFQLSLRLGAKEIHQVTHCPEKSNPFFTLNYT